MGFEIVDVNKIQGMMCWLGRGRERVGRESRECRGQEMARIMPMDGEIMRTSDGVGAKVTMSQELLLDHW